MRNNQIIKERNQKLAKQYSKLLAQGLSTKEALKSAAKNVYLSTERARKILAIKESFENEK